MTSVTKMPVAQTEAIQNVLNARTHADLAALYHPDMEVQVNVGRDGGEAVGGEFNGRQWQGYTNGLQTWKPFHIPWNVNTEPEYVDRPMTWDLGAHAEAIGMTGWDWRHRLSRWLGFDCDAIAGHAAGLTDGQLGEVREVEPEPPARSDAASAGPYRISRAVGSGARIRILDPRGSRATDSQAMPNGNGDDI